MKKEATSTASIVSKAQSGEIYSFAVAVVDYERHYVGMSSAPAAVKGCWSDSVGHCRNLDVQLA